MNPYSVDLRLKIIEAYQKKAQSVSDLAPKKWTFPISRDQQRMFRRAENYAVYLILTSKQKAEAVRIVEQSGKPISQVAREMGLTESALRRWFKQAQMG